MSNKRGTLLMEALVVVILFSVGIVGVLQSLSAAARAAGQADRRVTEAHEVHNRMVDYYLDPGVLLSEPAGAIVSEGLFQGQKNLKVLAFRNAAERTGDVGIRLIVYDK